MSVSNKFAVKCPVCDSTIRDQSNKSLPFCGERCRLIDLGRWLDEQHAVPCDQKDEEEETPAESFDGEQRPPVRLPPGWHDA